MMKIYIEIILYKSPLWRRYDVVQTKHDCNRSYTY